jgi:hypothetical protein
MSGEIDLETLLGSLSPQMMPGEFVFCSMPGARYGDHSDLAPVASICEPEGLTLVIPRAKADDHSVPYEGVYRGITLAVHSSLEAVGLTAAVSRRLAEHGMSANVVAGYYHDHIFVNAETAQRALVVLESVAR